MKELSSIFFTSQIDILNSFKDFRNTYIRPIEVFSPDIQIINQSIISQIYPKEIAIANLSAELQIIDADSDYISCFPSLSSIWYDLSSCTVQQYANFIGDCICKKIPSLSCKITQDQFFTQIPFEKEHVDPIAKCFNLSVLTRREDSQRMALYEVMKKISECSDYNGFMYYDTFIKRTVLKLNKIDNQISSIQIIRLSC